MPRKPLPALEKPIITTMRLPRTLLERLTAEADAAGMSRTRYVMHALEGWLDALDDQRAEPAKGKRR